MLYCNYNVLDMYRALTCPSSEAQDYTCVIAAYARTHKPGAVFLTADRQQPTHYAPCAAITQLYVDKKNQLDVTFCILYFSSNSCSTCFGQPFAHHQELTTA